MVNHDAFPNLLPPYKDFARIKPEVAKQFRIRYFVPFEVQPDIGDPYVVEIDPGYVPPTYFHSWRIELENIFEFYLSPSQNGVNLNWGDGDVIALFFPETGQIEKINTLETFQNKKIVVSLPKSKTIKSSITAYIILKTSTKRYAEDNKSYRRCCIDGLLVQSYDSNSHAILLGDTLNYDTANAWFVDGGGNEIWHPWVPGKNTDSTNFCEEPKKEDGWYLIGRFTEGEQIEPIWLLIYYNELKSLLRLYLLPTLKNITGLEIRIRLLSRDPDRFGEYHILTGAFFDNDPRPHNWGEAFIIIPRVVTNKWVMVESQILFPMAKQIPGASDTSMPKDPQVMNRIDYEYYDLPRSHEWYIPIYDCSFKEKYSNIRLQVEITPFLKGLANLDLIGAGIGTAIQDMTNQGFSPFTKIMDTVNTGIGAYNAAKEIKKGIEDGAKDLGLTTLAAAAAAIPIPYVAGAAACIAVIYKLVDWLSSDTELLRLSLELAIKGEIKGSVYTPLGKVQYECYLPGRFDAIEMITSEKLSLKMSTLEQYYPRYDRTLGHLGYRYDPSKLKLRINYFTTIGEQVIPDPGFGEGVLVKNEHWETSIWITWPASAKQSLLPYKIYKSTDPWFTGNSKHPAPIDAFLPVIYNEFAEIYMICPSDLNRVQLPELSLPELSERPTQRTHYYIDRPILCSPGESLELNKDNIYQDKLKNMRSVGSWSIWVYHEADSWVRKSWIGFHDDHYDQILIEDGFWLDAGAGRCVHTTRDFENYHDVTTNGFGQESIALFDNTRKLTKKLGTKDYYYLVTTDNSHGYRYRPYKTGDPWPLSDAVFIWEVAYLVYPLTRRQPSGRVYSDYQDRKMRSPVNFAIFNYDMSYYMDVFKFKSYSLTPSKFLNDYKLPDLEP